MQSFVRRLAAFLKRIFKRRIEQASEAADLTKLPHVEHVSAQQAQATTPAVTSANIDELVFNQGGMKLRVGVSVETRSIIIGRHPR